MVRDVAEDMNGNIWIATDHGGINILINVWTGCVIYEITRLTKRV